MKGKVTILGCGNSAGVPMIGNEWGVCDPQEPKNRRTRPSIHIQLGEKGIQIDTGPDVKEQINSFNINMIDAVLYTHDHSDHTQGIDDIRLWVTRRNKKIPAYGDRTTIENLTRRFDFILGQKETYPLYPLVMTPEIIEENTYNLELQMAEIPVTVFEQDHGRGASLGIRVGDIAYSTDFVHLPEASIETLKGVKTWIADAAAYHTGHLIHPTIQQVIDLNEQICAQQVYLTHMPVTMDYQTLLKELPEGYAPAYDGLVLDFEV